MFSTRMSTFRDFRSEWFAKWKAILNLDDRIFRKYWEYAVVSETLEANGLLSESRSGVGFGVGSDSLTTMIADRVKHVFATDLLPKEWEHVHQQFGELSKHPKVTTGVVDMNWIQGKIEPEAFDFSYSVCSMDHCGTVWWTKRFLLNQLNCLKAGGIGVHTAEYTINLGMTREGTTVWLTSDDVVDICDLFEKLGHEAAPVDWFIGDSIEDHVIDSYPYNGRIHLKCEASGKWGTCIVFAVRKKRDGVFWVPLDESEARAAIEARASK